MTDDTNNNDTGGTEDITESTFAIVITPQFADGEWSGSVSAHMEEYLMDDLDSDSVLQIRSVCGMMAATLELMEKDEDFYAYVHDYFVDKFTQLAEQIVEEAPTPNFTRSEDGKVITLHTNTKTHGSA